VLATEQRQLVVDRRHHQPDLLRLADAEQLRQEVGVARQRHAVGAVGDVHRRRQRIDVGDDDRAGQAQRAQRMAEGLHQRHAP
jgi:hypothetical protein